MPIILTFTSSIAMPAIAGSSMDASSKDLTSAIINLFVLVIAVAILITGLNYSVPRKDFGG
jgi:hypothetical protein